MTLAVALIFTGVAAFLTYWIAHDSAWDLTRGMIAIITTWAVASIFWIVWLTS